MVTKSFLLFFVVSYHLTADPNLENTWDYKQLLGPYTTEAECLRHEELYLNELSKLSDPRYNPWDLEEIPRMVPVKVYSLCETKEYFVNIVKEQLEKDGL